MNNAYEYDVEIYPNLFEVTFIPKTADQKLIDVYKAVDIRCLAIKNGKEGNLEELKEAKAKLLLAMGAKQFVIWIDYTTGKWRNDGPLIMDFFIQHKILTGYNSNNYDKIMLDIFINNYKYLDVKGFNKKESKHITQILYDHSCACVDIGKRNIIKKKIILPVFIQTGNFQLSGFLDLAHAFHAVNNIFAN